MVAQDIKELKGSLTLRLIILLVATGRSLGLFAINAWLPGITPDFLSNGKEEPLLFASANMLLLLFGAAFSYTTITGGIVSIVRLRPERDSLPALAAVVCVIQNACGHVLTPPLWHRVRQRSFVYAAGAFGAVV